MRRSNKSKGKEEKDRKKREFSICRIAHKSISTISFDVLERRRSASNFRGHFRSYIPGLFIKQIAQHITSNMLDHLSRRN